MGRILWKQNRSPSSARSGWVGFLGWLYSWAVLAWTGFIHLAHIYYIVFSVPSSAVINFETVLLCSPCWPLVLCLQASQVPRSQACSTTLNSVVHSSEFWCWEHHDPEPWSGSQGDGIMFGGGASADVSVQHILLRRKSYSEGRNDGVSIGKSQTIQVSFVIRYLETESDCNLSYPGTR